MILKRRKRIYLLIFFTYLFITYPIFANYSSNYISIINEANQLIKKGDFEKALDIINNLKSLNRTLPLDKRIDIFILLGLLYWNTGNIKESLANYEYARNLIKEVQIRPDTALIIESAISIIGLYNKAKTARDNREFSISINYFKEAINISKSISSREHEIKCLRQLSLVYWYCNDLKEFFFTNSEALSIARSLNLFRDVSICLNNIGLYYYKEEDYLSALSNFESSLELSQKNKYIQSESECLTNIGVLYKDIGDYDKALSSFNKALEIDNKYFGNDFISNDLNNIGTIYRKKGILSDDRKYFEQSLKYFLKSLELIETTKDIKNRIRILNNLGTAYSDLKEYAKALLYYEKSLNLAKETKDTEIVCVALNNIGIVNSNLGKLEESLANFQQAIDFSRDISAGEILWEAFLEMANTYKKQNNYLNSLKSYQNSIKIIERIRSSIKAEEYKSIYLGTDRRIDAFYNIIDLLYSLLKSENNSKYAEQALNYLERAKARAFLDSLEVAKISLTSDLEPKLANQEGDLSNRISATLKVLSKPDQSPAEIDKAYFDLKELEDDYERLKSAIRTTNPVYSNLLYPEIITTSNIRDNILDNNTLIVSYSIGKEQSFGFAITKNSLNFFKTSPRKDMHTKVISFLNSISNKENNSFLLGRELYKELILPGMDKEINKIIIIPDDILYYLPFETLICDSDGTWLIRKTAIEYAPSITSLWEIIKRDKKRIHKQKVDLLAFGNPKTKMRATDLYDSRDSISDSLLKQIKNSGIEINKITKYFRKNKWIAFQNNEASEQTLKNLKLDNYRILHFATHGIINDKIPSRSSIVLASNSNSPEDGLLQTREIYNFKMNAELVTLSACRTALGQYIRGEGIEGINRAFFYAGASSVLMSLWEVNDQASAYLMDRFYYYLTSSYPINSALQKAKIDMIEFKEFSHPYYWAPFIVAGHADKIMFPRKRPLFSAILVLSGLVLIISFIIYLRNKRL